MEIIVQHYLVSTSNFLLLDMANKVDYKFVHFSRSSNQLITLNVVVQNFDPMQSLVKLIGSFLLAN